MNIGSNPVSGKISYKNSLRARLLVFFLAFSIIPLVVISAISYFQSQNAIIERIKSDLKVQTDLQGTMLKTFLRERKDNMIVLAGTARVRTMDPTKVTDAIDQYFKQWGLYENLGLYSPDGNTVYRTDKTSINVFDREYFQTALKGETNIADPLVSKASGNIVYVVAAPVVEGGKIVGVISGSIPTTVFDDYIGANDLGNGDGYLVNNAGFLITASNHTQELIKAGKIINRSELEYQPDTLAVKSILEGKPGVAEYRDSFGETVIGAFSLIEGSTWGLVIENRTSEVLVDVYALRTLYIIAILLAIMIVIGLAIVISNNITRPILQIANMSQMIARGEIPDEEIKVTSKDEIGLLMNSFREIVECFTNIAQVTTSLADGDLTAPVTIHSEKDILGNALNRMEIRLREVIGQMISHADTLDNSSLELATTAQDVDSVTSQISTTIQQIAKGTSLQAESVTRTASNVEELSKTVESVAKGAQEQSSAITNASEVTSQLTVTIEQVTGNAQAVLRDSNNAAEAARKGTGTVQKTLDEMQAIKNSVSQSTLKVQEMGERSGQIGEILTTIEDIASQTNMLALNAAIEAARAGESGKGFAVVADEVRKLAERVSLSTKEIGDLIRGIQTIVSEAMQSMELGTQEVDKGVVLANQAGEALNDILLAADAVNNQAKEAVIATQKMTAAANELVTEVDTVSSVIETNTAATEEMAASAFEVSQAVENIASVSEENSAAVEQVSASTEEMAARVEEVSAAATGLSELAKQMKSMVNRFKVNS